MLLPKSLNNIIGFPTFKMIQTLKMKTLQQAVDYFLNLPEKCEMMTGARGKLYAIPPTESKNYARHFDVAVRARDELRKYPREGLEYIATQGIMTPASVHVGTAQRRVDLLPQELGTGIQLSADDIQQIMSVLVAYGNIFPSESQVPNLPKIQAVKVALELNRRG